MIILIIPATAEQKGDSDITKDFLKIDTLFERGLKEYHYQSNNQSLKETLDLCLELAKKYPDDYDVLWRCARSLGIYAESLIGTQPEGWKNVCLEWGKKGEIFAFKAQRINPYRVEDYSWQISCTGSFGFVCGLLRQQEKAYTTSSGAVWKSPMR